MAKVVHVHLLVGKHEGRKDFYFSSISAVYTVLTAEEVGATKGYLLHARAWRKRDGMHETRYNKAIYAHFGRSDG